MTDPYLYHYLAVVTRIVDGDTVIADISLGLHTWIHGERLRLARINTLELHGDNRLAGMAARDFLSGLVLDKEVYIKTIKDTKERYGRYLAEVIVEQDGIMVNVNDALVLAGHAVLVEY